MPRVSPPLEITENSGERFPDLETAQKLSMPSLARDLDDDKPELQTHCDVCGDKLECEPLAIMQKFIDIAKGRGGLILKEGINFNINNPWGQGRPPPS